MANAINFSAQASRQSIFFKTIEGITLNSLSSKGPGKFKQPKMKIQQHGIRMRRQEKIKRSIIVSSTNSNDFESSPLSASEMIREFYACINAKNLKRLGACISNDCFFEDCSFPQPFKGKKEVMHFFEQLTTSMGRNVKFNIEHICEGDELTAAVNWHLEWKKRQIPFTRGCSFYECSIEGEGLLIKKARTMIESPIKPGDIVLTLLKNLTSLLDAFPKTAEWTLNRPQVILKHLLKIYTTLLAAFINPIITGYIRMWNFMAQLLGLALNILLYILKIFLK